MQESDRALKDFLTSLRSLDRKVVVVFFGDHQPFFPDTFNDQWFTGEDEAAHQERLWQTSSHHLGQLRRRRHDAIQRARRPLRQLPRRRAHAAHRRAAERLPEVPAHAARGPARHQHDRLRGLRDALVPRDHRNRRPAGRRRTRRRREGAAGLRDDAILRDVRGRLADLHRARADRSERDQPQPRPGHDEDQVIRSALPTQPQRDARRPPLGSQRAHSIRRRMLE
ncbi:MAG: hypothetical protein ACLTSX_12825 [Collinsella sp.]